MSTDLLTDRGDGYLERKALWEQKDANKGSHL